MMSQSDPLSLKFGRTSWKIPGTGIVSLRLDRPAIQDWAAAIDQSLNCPIGFTSVAHALVPGDQVALAIDPALPSMDEVVTGIARWLVEQSVDPNDLCVVIPAEPERVQQLQNALDAAGLSGARAVRHEADDQEQVSYLAADDHDLPIYLNRILVDADVVIPICCARSSQAIDYLGSFFGIFPLFSNRETRSRVHSFSKLRNPRQHAVLTKAANQAAWCLGAIVSVVVIPTADDGIAQILCGAMESLDTAVADRVGRRAPDDLAPDLVIAALDGSQQDWQAVARALYQASNLCVPEGTIVLCTELSELPGSGLRRLRDFRSDPAQLERRLAHDGADDALAAAVVLNATQDHHVYLISQLRRDTTESLGMACLKSLDELLHLIRQFSIPVVLHSAQHG